MVILARSSCRRLAQAIDASRWILLKAGVRHRPRTDLACLGHSGLQRWFRFPWVRAEMVAAEDDAARGSTPPLRHAVRRTVRKSAGVHAGIAAELVDLVAGRLHQDRRHYPRDSRRRIARSVSRMRRAPRRDAASRAACGWPPTMSAATRSMARSPRNASTLRPAMLLPSIGPSLADGKSAGGIGEYAAPRSSAKPCDHQRHKGGAEAVARAGRIDDLDLVSQRMPSIVAAGQRADAARLAALQHHDSGRPLHDNRWRKRSRRTRRGNSTARSSALGSTKVEMASSAFTVSR